MTKKELYDHIERLTGEDCTGTISDKDYRDIEYVYTWHPSINETGGKLQMAALVYYGGMPVIRDMMATSGRAQALYEEEQAARRAYEQARDKYKAFRNGNPS